MCNAFDRPLRVELRASRRLAAAWFILCAGAAGGLCLLPLPWPLRLLLLGLLTLYAWFVYRLHARLDLPLSVRAIAWDRQQGWRLRRHNGVWRRATLCKPVLVSHRLAALQLQTGRWRRQRVVVVGDRCDAEDFRRLRVRLIQSAHGDRDRAEIPGAR